MGTITILRADLNDMTEALNSAHDEVRYLKRVNAQLVDELKKRKATTACVQPIPDDCLPAPHLIQQLLRGPQLDTDGRIVGGLYDGMTPAEVTAQAEEYRRLFGDKNMRETKR